VVATLVGIAASDTGGSGDRRGRGRDKLSGTVAIDGTVALLETSERAASAFELRHPGVRVTVGASGDLNAIDSFCAGEVDIAEVARRFKPRDRRQCRAGGVRYVPIHFAREGIALVVSDRNRFATCLTLDQIRSIWRPDSPVRSWAEVGPNFPDVELRPIGWKPDSPPHTLFAEGLFGPVNPLTRDDYEITPDATGLERVLRPSAGGLGYMPLGELNQGAGVRPLELGGRRGCVMPTMSTVRDGRYPALSRPLDLNVNRVSLRRPEVQRFVSEYLRAARKLRAAAGVAAARGSQRLYRKFTRP
jgi:phosphate transport system substrate-binding protein